MDKRPRGANPSALTYFAQALGELAGWLLCAQARALIAKKAVGYQQARASSRKLTTRGERLGAALAEQFPHLSRVYVSVARLRRTKRRKLQEASQTLPRRAFIKQKKNWPICRMWQKWRASQSERACND